MQVDILLNVYGSTSWWSINTNELSLLEQGKVPDSFKNNGDTVEKTGDHEYKIFFTPKSAPQEPPQDTPPDAYSGLRRILDMAFQQASQGKGKERHANGREFDRQPIMELARMHGLGYPTGQAAKKLQEAHTLLRLRGKEAAIQEILGAINYAAAAVLLIEEKG